MSKMDEMIIVVPRTALFANEQLTFTGVQDGELATRMLMDNISNNFGVMRRGDAEENAIFKQPIPYAVLRRGNEIFMYERLTGGGEARLHNKLSIGVGGHMNVFPTDGGFYSLLVLNMDRELKEELSLSNDNSRAKIIGFINDDSTPVNKVHIGVLVVVDLPEDCEVEVNEKDKLLGSWTTLSQLQSADYFGRLEDWSKIVVNTLTK